jgi:hypothetical protein
VVERLSCIHIVFIIHIYGVYMVQRSNPPAPLPWSWVSHSTVPLPPLWCGGGVGWFVGFVLCVWSVWYGMFGKYGMFGMYGRYGMYGMSGWYCMDGRYGM